MGESREVGALGRGAECGKKPLELQSEGQVLVLGTEPIVLC